MMQSQPLRGRGKRITSSRSSLTLNSKASLGYMRPKHYSVVASVFGVPETLGSHASTPSPIESM